MKKILILAMPFFMMAAYSQNQASEIKTEVAENMVFVKGSTVYGKKNKAFYQGTFKEDSITTLRDFYIGRYEVTQAEYREIMQNQIVSVTLTKDYTDICTLDAEPSLCSKKKQRHLRGRLWK